jgi:cystathionine gamma-synthase
MNPIFELSCGQTIPPNNIHAVSVSIPRMGDVIGYEEKHPDTMKKIKSGYPRFVPHPYILQIQQLFHEKFDVAKNKEVILISSPQAAEELFDFLGKQVEMIADQNIFAVCIDKDTPDDKNTRSFLQHTGYMPSSRVAEQYLFEKGALLDRFDECLYLDADPQEFIINTLRDAYGLKMSAGISLGICGMNAVFAALRSLERIQQKEERNIFVQFGWLYLDTMEILRKFRSHTMHVEAKMSIAKLENFLKAKGNQTAAIFTEVTTNPLIQTPDLPALYKLARQYDIPVVVDATFGTPYNVDVTPYADIIIESLTKFACGNADVMMGALIVNQRSPWYSDITNQVSAFLETPFEGDMRRLAFQIGGYKTRMEKINQNTLALIEYFKTCEHIKEIYWPYQEPFREHYQALQKHSKAAGGVISLVFDQPLEKVYDRINLPKGPSLGTEFTLLMPYVYLAHYDLVSTQQGRKHLEAVGIHPDLLRVSVGLENVETIIGIFDEALK